MQALYTSLAPNAASIAYCITSRSFRSAVRSVTCYFPVIVPLVVIAIALIAAAVRISIRLQNVRGPHTMRRAVRNSNSTRSTTSDCC